jgi:hypothetical protein
VVVSDQLTRAEGADLQQRGDVPDGPAWPDISTTIARRSRTGFFAVRVIRWGLRPSCMDNARTNPLGLRAICTSRTRRAGSLAGPVRKTMSLRAELQASRSAWHLRGLHVGDVIRLQQATFSTELLRVMRTIATEAGVVHIDEQLEDVTGTPAPSPPVRLEIR